MSLVKPQTETVLRYLPLILLVVFEVAFVWWQINKKTDVPAANTNTLQPTQSAPDPEVIPTQDADDTDDEDDRGRGRNRGRDHPEDD